MAKTSPSAGMTAHVAQRVTSLTDLVKITARDNTVIGLTRLDKDLIYDDGDGGTTYLKTHGLTISAVANTYSSDIDNMTIEVFAKTTGFDRNDIINGKWRNAEIKTYRVNWKDVLAGGSQGAWKIRRGRVGDVKLGKAVTIECQGLLGRYRKEQVELTSPLCRAVHGDARCKIDLIGTTWTLSTALSVRLPFSAGETAGNVETIIKPTTPNDRWFETQVAGTTGGTEPSWNTTLDGTTSDGGVTHKTIRARRVNVNVISATPTSIVTDYSGDAPDGFFGDGYFVINTGDLAGQVFPISTWTLSTDTIEVFEPMPVLLTGTDDIDMVAGCDLTRDNCINFYDNISNRRAESHLPGDNFRHRVYIPPASG